MHKYPNYDHHNSFAKPDQQANIQQQNILLSNQQLSYQNISIPMNNMSQTELISDQFYYNQQDIDYQKRKNEGVNEHGFYITMQMHTDKLDHEKKRKLSQKIATNQLLSIDQNYQHKYVTKYKQKQKRAMNINIIKNNLSNKNNNSYYNNQKSNHNASSTQSIINYKNRKQNQTATNSSFANSAKVGIIHGIHKINSSNTNLTAQCCRQSSAKQAYAKFSDSQASLNINLNLKQHESYNQINHHCRANSNASRNSRHSKRNSRNMSNFERLKYEAEQLERSNVVLGIKQQNTLQMTQTNIKFNGKSKSKAKRRQHMHTNIGNQNSYSESKYIQTSKNQTNNKSSGYIMINQLLKGQKKGGQNIIVIQDDGNYVQMHNKINENLENKDLIRHMILKDQIKLNIRSKNDNQQEPNQNDENNSKNLGRTGSAWYPNQTYKTGSASTHHRTYTHLYTQPSLQTNYINNTSHIHMHTHNKTFYKTDTQNSQYMINNEFVPMASRSILDKNRSNIRRIDKNRNKNKTQRHQSTIKNYKLRQNIENQISFGGSKAQIMELLKNGQNKNFINMDCFNRQNLNMPKQQISIESNNPDQLNKNVKRGNEAKQSPSESSLLCLNTRKDWNKTSNTGVNPAKYFKNQQQKIKNKASFQIVDPYFKTKAMGIARRNQNLKQRDNSQIVIVCL